MKIGDNVKVNMDEADDNYGKRRKYPKGIIVEKTSYEDVWGVRHRNTGNAGRINFYHETRLEIL